MRPCPSRPPSAGRFAALLERRDSEADLARAFLEAIDGDLTSARLVLALGALGEASIRLRSQARILEAVIASEDISGACSAHLLEWPSDDLVLIFTAVHMGFSGADDRHDAIYELVKSLPRDGLSSFGLIRLAHAAADVDELDEAFDALSAATRLSRHGDPSATGDDVIHAEIHALEAAQDLEGARLRLSDHLRNKSADDLYDCTHLLAHLAFIEAELWPRRQTSAISDFLERASGRLGLPGVPAQLALDYLRCLATSDVTDAMTLNSAEACRVLCPDRSRCPPLWALGSVACAGLGHPCGALHPLPRATMQYASARTVDAVRTLVSTQHSDATPSLELCRRLGGSRSEYGRIARSMRRNHAITLASPRAWSDLCG